MQVNINIRLWDAYNDNIQNQMFCSYPVIYANQLYFYSISNICILLNNFSFKYFCTLRPIIIWLQIFFEEKNLTSQFWFSCSFLQLEVKVISTQWMLCYLPWYKKRKKWFVISLFLVVFGIWDAAAVLNLTRTQKCDNDTEEWQLEWMVHWAC